VNGHPAWTGEVRFVEKALTLPLQWKRPRRIFVNALSDLFHENVPDEWIDRIFAVMALAQQHTFQILTKRPERMKTYVLGLGKSFERLKASCPVGWSMEFEGIPLVRWPLGNVWLGVSVEDQATADERIPVLLETQAAIRWVSYEPALEQVSFSRWLSALSWIVVGGESGASARLFELEWARRTVVHCQAAGCAVFVKQFGSSPVDHGEPILMRGKADDPADWPLDLRVQEYPGRMSDDATIA
jgi:protein gp37